MDTAKTMSIEDQNRQSGRTVRLLRHYGKLKEEGVPAKIVVASRRHVVYLRDKAMSVLDLAIPHDDFVGIGDEFIDLGTLTLRGFRGELLFDHYALYVKFGRIIEEYHKYDLGTIADHRTKIATEFNVPKLEMSKSIFGASEWTWREILRYPFTYFKIKKYERDWEREAAESLRKEIDKTILKKYGIGE